MANPERQAGGPLTGLKVLEFAGIGPGPYACMLLSDMGAEVVTIDRPGRMPPPGQIVARGRQVVQVDLKDVSARDDVLTLIDASDVLVEGFRPGVMEPLGLGPETLRQRNPRLVYGRMTGWGQQGPLAQSAGHDINYIAITGALHAIGPAHGAPVPPLNLLGDFGGGSLFLVMGILAALHERARSGHGQVVDAAISDGTLSLMSYFVAAARLGQFQERRASNRLDGGAPYYGVYETADGGYMAVGAIEPQFFAEFARRVGLPEVWLEAQDDRPRWPELRAVLERIFLSRTRAQWTALLECTDACCVPVLSLGEALQHPHHQAREAAISVDGMLRPAAAPRFSRTPSSAAAEVPATPGSLSDILARWRSPAGVAKG